MKIPQGLKIKPRMSVSSVNKMGAIDQLESVTLMMQVLDQANGGSTPTE